MTITRKDLDTRYAHWFRNVSQPEQAKAEILKQFGEEPEPYEWTEQDIWEQSRKILIKWSQACYHITRAPTARVVYYISSVCYQVV